MSGVISLRRFSLGKAGVEAESVLSAWVEMPKKAPPLLTVTERSLREVMVGAEIRVLEKVPVREVTATVPMLAAGSVKSALEDANLGAPAKMRELVMVAAEIDRI